MCPLVDHVGNDRQGHVLRAESLDSVANQRAELFERIGLLLEAVILALIPRVLRCGYQRQQVIEPLVNVIPGAVFTLARVPTLAVVDRVCE